MSNELYGEHELEALLSDENILNGVFECLCRIWGDEDALDSENLSYSEHRTRVLEYKLLNMYPSLYEELISKMGNHPVRDLETGCGVIMDALSIREAARLKTDLQNENGWDVTFSWAAIERLPSETQFICEKWFDAQAPSAVSRDDFRFIGDKDVPQLPATDPAFVWTRHPDQRLEGALKGNYSAEKVETIYQGVKELVENIISESAHDEFLITSDHGYVNHLGRNSSPYTVSDEQEDSLSKKFSGRFVEIGNSQAYRLLEDANIIKRVNKHYVIQGHYDWTKRGATKKISHGGLSLMECITPTVRINTNNTGGE